MLPQTDLWMMTALAFLPTLFALVILFVPKGRDEVMRWLALFGTAVTLAPRLLLLMGYPPLQGVLVPPSSAEANYASLEARADAAKAAGGITTTPASGTRQGLAPSDSN